MIFRFSKNGRVTPQRAHVVLCAPCGIKPGSKEKYTLLVVARQGREVDSRFENTIYLLKVVQVKTQSISIFFHSSLQCIVKAVRVASFNFKGDFYA